MCTTEHKKGIIYKSTDLHQRSPVKQHPGDSHTKGGMGTATQPNAEQVMWMRSDKINLSYVGSNNKHLTSAHLDFFFSFSNFLNSFRSFKQSNTLTSMRSMMPMRATVAMAPPMIAITLGGSGQSERTGIIHRSFYAYVRWIHCC